MEEVYDALVDLRTAVEKHTKLQEDTNDILRALNSILMENSQAMADLQDEIKQRFPTR